MAVPLVLQAIRQHKAALLARERAQMAQMAHRWLYIERFMQQDILALAAELQAEAAAGRTAGMWKIKRMQRYQTMIGQLEAQMGLYEQYASGGHGSGAVSG